MPEAPTPKRLNTAPGKMRPVRRRVKPCIVLRLNQMQSPEIARTLKELHTKYGKYAIPVGDLRKLMDKAMGARTLTEELEAMREGR